MNYYKFHIGDFRSGTVNMSRLSRWIYRDMLDVYYDTEQPLPIDTDRLCAEIGVEDAAEVAIVERLLKFKFQLTDEGYRHATCDRVIAEYHGAADTARENGKRGGRPRKPTGTQPVPSGNQSGTQEKPSGFLSGSDPVASGLQSGTQPAPSGAPDETGSKANHEPLTINQETTPLTPQGGRKPAVGIKSFLADCKTQSVKPVPENDQVFQYAEDVGIPRDFLWLAWREFVDRHQDSDKRYKDWRRAFRNCVRSNWYRLWWADPSNGEYQLTTNGVQAQRKHREAA